MNALTLEWVKKADADFGTAEREAAVTQGANPDGVCFHAQQCVEKYLKAVLQESGRAVPRTHDLVALLTLVLPVEPAWAAHEVDLLFLNSFAVEYRYPGYSATAGDAQRAVATMHTLRAAIRQHLGLS
jgi:HEPN domain-containing protein